MSLKQQQAKMNWALQEICITLGSEIMKGKKAKQNFCSCILNAYSPGYGNTLFFFYKNVVFPAQAEYSYFSADFRLKIFLYYS